MRPLYMLLLILSWYLSAASSLLGQDKRSEAAEKRDETKVVEPDKEKLSDKLEPLDWLIGDYDRAEISSTWVNDLSIKASPDGEKLLLEYKTVWDYCEATVILKVLEVIRWNDEKRSLESTYTSKAVEFRSSVNPDMKKYVGTGSYLIKPDPTDPNTWLCEGEFNGKWPVEFHIVRHPDGFVFEKKWNERHSRKVFFRQSD